MAKMVSEASMRMVTIACMKSESRVMLASALHNYSITELTTREREDDGRTMVEEDKRMSSIGAVWLVTPFGRMTTECRPASSGSSSATRVLLVLLIVMPSRD